LLDHLRAMANNLSLFSKDPQQEGTEGRTDLARWCGQVRGFIEASAGSSVYIKWDIPDSLPEVAIAPHRMTQAVLNLVHNARDAILSMKGPLAGTPGAGRIDVEARLDPTASATNRRVVVKVSDNGVGMDEETKRRCIEPFFTTKDRSGAGTPSGGTGLGLSLVHAIVERVKGRMEIDSEIGVGTTITMRLPLAEPSLSSLLNDSDQYAANVGSAGLGPDESSEVR
ncbi:MAG TPA: ATP-binding protein, partial [Phycisphaerales bacterium]|nr:ATP-binding protein [Phycisphaerales bacterium]